MLKNLFRSAEARTSPDVPASLIEALEVKGLPPGLEVPGAVAEIQAALGLVQDRRGLELNQQDLTALRERRASLQHLVKRQRLVAKLRTYRAAVEADRAEAAASVRRASEAHERASGAAALAADKVRQLDERLAKVNAARATNSAARTASVSAAEDDVRRALADGDEAAEDAASQRLASLLAAPAEDPALRLRADELERMRSAAAAESEQRDRELAAALRELRTAQAEVAAVAWDEQLNALAGACWGLLDASAAAEAAGLEKGRVRYTPNGGGVHVFRAARVWFTSPHLPDGPVDANLVIDLDAIRSLLAKPVGDLHGVDGPLPSGTTIRELTESIG